jgi:hypothetical protein
MEKMYKMLYIPRHLYSYTKCRGPFGLFFFHRGLFHLALCSSTLSQYPSFSIIPPPLHHSFSIVPLRYSFTIPLPYAYSITLAFPPLYIRSCFLPQALEVMP